MKTIAFISGSGLSQKLNSILDLRPVYDNTNLFGKVSDYHIGRIGDLRVVVMSRHGDPVNDKPIESPAELVNNRRYEANIWQLARMDVKELFLTSAVGYIDEQPLSSEGYFMLPETYIRGLSSPLVTFGSSSKILHPPMSEPFNLKTIAKVQKAIWDLGIDYELGTYIQNGGDSFETPYEIAHIQNSTLGKNRVVGMTTVPEVILASQMGIPVATICSIVNPAEGLSKSVLVSHEQTLEVMKKAGDYVSDIVKNIIKDYV